MVCGPNHAAAARRILRKLPKENLLVEPCPRNTAPCVGLAALHVKRRDPKGVMVMLPADHHVARPEAMREALAAGGAAGLRGCARHHRHPPRPARDRLRLPQGGRQAEGARARQEGLPPVRVERFVEKPDVVTAARYLADGGYLWNAGIFLFRADVILEEIRRAMPVLGEQLDGHRAVARHPRLRPHAGPGLPGLPLHLHRLRGHGEEPAHRGGPGRVRLERRRAASRPSPRSASSTTWATCCRATPSSSTATTTWCSATASARSRWSGVDGLVVVDAGDAVLVVPQGEGPGRAQGGRGAEAARARVAALGGPRERKGARHGEPSRGRSSASTTSAAGGQGPHRGRGAPGGARARHRGARGRAARRVVLGRDCRESGPRFATACSRGSPRPACDVIDVGVVPTPLTYFAAAHPPGGRARS